MQPDFIAPDGEKKDYVFFKNDAKSGKKKVSGLRDDVKILVVDDNVNFLESLTDSLRAENIRCVDVKSGPEAIEAVKKETFDLILLDVKMDEMDGLDTYKKLKESGSTCPIIFMSAFYEEYKKDIRGLNPFAVLEKPIDFNRLLSYIVKKP